MKTFFSGLALAALVSGSAWGATTSAPAPAPAAGKTQTQAEAVAPTRLKDRISAQLLSTLWGPSLASMVGDSANPTSYTIDANGAQDAPIFFESTVRTGYKLTNAVSAALAINFNYSPVLGQDLTFVDPYVRLAHSKLIDRGNLSMSGDFRVYLPISNSAHQVGRLTILRTNQSTSYKVGNSRWTLSLDTFARGYIYNDSTAKKILEVYMGPSISYQATPNLSAGLLYEAAGKLAGGATLNDWASSGTYLSPSISWDVTPAINLNPWITFQSLRINPESTQLGMNLSAKFL